MKEKTGFLILIVSLMLFINTSCSTSNSPSEAEEKATDIQYSHTRKGESDNVNYSKNKNMAMGRYENISTAPSYIKIQINDTNTAKIFNMVLENTDFADFLMSDYGISYEEYPDYMMQRQGKTFDISINSLRDSITKKFDNNKRIAKEFFNDCFYSSALTFTELGVKDEKELLEKYFEYKPGEIYGLLRGEYYEKYRYNAAFIALLLDLGYDVVRGDIVPILYIYEQPFIKGMK